jgi:hypothetical protein
MASAEAGERSYPVAPSDRLCRSGILERDAEEAKKAA